MNTGDIIHAFTHNRPGVFPREALQHGMDQPKAITPHLVTLLQKGGDDITALANTKDDNGFLYAMFLLAQFKEATGLAPLIKFFCTEGMTAIMLTGDVVTETLSKLFAGMAGENHAPLTDLIEDPAQNSFVRAAAIEALLCLVAWDEMTLETLEAYFLELLTGKLEQEPSHVWNYLADAVSRVGSSRCAPALEQAYKANLTNGSLISWDEAKELLMRSPEQKMKDLKADQGLAPITNVIEEMQDWACFTPVIERMAPIKIPKSANPVPIAAQPGRNDPCPCGSGKKFKKCCIGPNLA